MTQIWFDVLPWWLKEINGVVSSVNCWWLNYLCLKLGQPMENQLQKHTLFTKTHIIHLCRNPLQWGYGSNE